MQSNTQHTEKMEDEAGNQTAPHIHEEIMDFAQDLEHEKQEEAVELANRITEMVEIQTFEIKKDEIEGYILKMNGKRIGEFESRNKATSVRDNLLRALGGSR